MQERTFSVCLQQGGRGGYSGPALLASERDRSAAEGFPPSRKGLVWAWYGSSQMVRPPLNEETCMDTTKTDPAIENDVLHLGSPTKLSPEEIAKALAHHNRHHSGDQPQQAAAKLDASKKGKKSK